MRSSATVAKYILPALLTAAGLMALGSLGSTARAGNSLIDVRVCGSESTASVSISEPDSDSTVERQPIIVKGRVTDVSHLSVMVDGVYSHSKAIARGQTEFQTPVSVAAGTHTIELVGNDICSIADPAASVVVSYAPAVPPSNGDEMPTSVGSDRPGSSGGAVVGGGGDVESSDDRNPRDDAEWVDSLPSPIRDTIRTIDLQTVTQDGLVSGLLRVAAVLLGAALIAGARVVANIFKPDDTTAKAPYKRLVMIQLIGIGLILLALVL